MWFKKQHLCIWKQNIQIHTWIHNEKFSFWNCITLLFLFYVPLLVYIYAEYKTINSTTHKLFNERYFGPRTKIRSTAHFDKWQTTKTSNSLIRVQQLSMFLFLPLPVSALSSSSSWESCKTCFYRHPRLHCHRSRPSSSSSAGRWCDDDVENRGE